MSDSLPFLKYFGNNYGHCINNSTSVHVPINWAPDARPLDSDVDVLLGSFYTVQRRA